jgi:predicted Zn-dependent protease
MAFPGLEPAAVARSLGLIAGEADEPSEVYFERRVEIELPSRDGTVGLRVRREEGVAARIGREGRAWIASRDGLSGRHLAEALRQAARAWPPAAPEPWLEVGPSPVVPPWQSVAEFPGRLERELRRRLAAFPLRLTVRWHRLDVQVVGPRMVPPAEREELFSLDAELPWGRCGELTTRLDDARADAFARRLVARFKAREAPPPAAGRTRLWLAPAACAVALHETVAHALEADVLAAGGRPEAAIGLDFGAPALDVLDDPAAAPAGVERGTDDEGVPVVRRWLLRGGRVEQPLADLGAARRWPGLLPGSGFRGGRHGRPRPRTHHLELLPGSAGDGALAAAAEGGLWVGEVTSGALDPASGRFVLDIPSARRVARGSEPGEAVGGFRVAGRVAELLANVVAVGALVETAGAGWCAKGGERRAVWATVPAIVVDGLEVTA